MKSKFVNYCYALFISFFLCIIAYALKKGDGYYIFDSVKFIIFITIFYLFYEKLNFNEFIFTLLGTVMVLHGLGRFGFFNYNVWIFPWDTITHFFSSFAIVIAFFKIIEKSNLSYGWKIFIVFMTGLGIATLGEFIEFFGAIKTPKGQGILGVESRSSPIAWLSPDYWDTMKDLIINAAGNIFGLVVWHLRQVIQGRYRGEGTGRSKKLKGKP